MRGPVPAGPLMGAGAGRGGGGGGDDDDAAPTQAAGKRNGRSTAGVGQGRSDGVV